MPNIHDAAILPLDFPERLLSVNKVGRPRRALSLLLDISRIPDGSEPGSPLPLFSATYIASRAPPKRGRGGYWATAVQAILEIAQQAKQFTVFQRIANYR
jgi:hypothetical protein